MVAGEIEINEEITGDAAGNAAEPLEQEDLRTVVALNKKYGIGQLLNAAGHTVLGLGSNAVGVERLAVQKYVDADGTEYPNIGYHPVIALKADNGNHLRRFRHSAEQAGLPFSCFVDTMFQGGTPVQLETTASTAGTDLDYVAVAVFGPAAVLRELTKKFRLFS